MYAQLCLIWSLWSRVPSTLGAQQYGPLVCKLSCYLQNVQHLPLPGSLKPVFETAALSLSPCSWPCGGDSASHSEPLLFEVHAWCLVQLFALTLGKSTYVGCNVQRQVSSPGLILLPFLLDSNGFHLCRTIEFMKNVHTNDFIYIYSNYKI